MIIQVCTPAKINLILEILHKRSDGFHEIQSIMQAVSLYDYLTIEIQNLGFSNNNVIEITGNSSLIPYDRDNLVYQAAELYFAKAKLRNKKVNIYIEKNIPIAAGLAGGSSNAAGILWGLNQLCKKALTSSQLKEIATILGSDISFCLEGGTQIASSRGETLSRISTPDLNIAIVKPKNLTISAQEAYSKYDCLAQKPDIKGIEEMEAAIYRNVSDKISNLLNNHLESAILPNYPELQKIKNYLIQKGCKNTLMSGSGPCIFGIYENNIDFSDINSAWEYYKASTINSGIKGKIIRRPLLH